MSDRTKVIIHAIEFLLILAIAGWLYFTYNPVPPSSGESVIAKQAPAVKREPTKEVVIKAPVKAYVGKTKANLKLPDAIQKDDKEQVIAATQSAPSLRPTTTSTVINTETGEVQTFTKVDPYPWLAWEPRGEIGIAYGYKSTLRCASFQCDTDAKRVARLQFGFDAIRIKALTAGVVITADSDRDVFAGARVRFQW